MRNVSLLLTQLGVDNNQIAQRGGLANNSLFFGDNTTETISAPHTFGGWNGDRSYTVTSTEQWAAFSIASNYGEQAGLFSPDSDNGAFGTGSSATSHRTILSGY